MCLRKRFTIHNDANKTVRLTLLIKKKKRKDCKGYKGSYRWKRKKPKHFKSKSRWSINAQKGKSVEISVTNTVTGDAKEGGWLDSSLQREFPPVHFLEIFWFSTYSTYLLENNSKVFIPG